MDVLPGARTPVQNIEHEGLLTGRLFFIVSLSGAALPLGRPEVRVAFAGHISKGALEDYKSFVRKNSDVPFRGDPYGGIGPQSVHKRRA